MPQMTWYFFPAFEVYVVPFPAGHTEEGALLVAEEVVEVVVGLGVEELVD